MAQIRYAQSIDLNASPVYLMTSSLYKVCVVMLSALSFNAFSAGDRLVEKILSSDFDFTMGESISPTIRIGYLDFQDYPAGGFADICPTSLRCDFNQMSLQQGFGAPVWVGRKNMLVAAQTINVHHFSNDNTSFNLYSAGLLVAWLQQYDVNTQWGGFYYKKLVFEDIDNSFSSPGYTSGLISRYKHKSTLHSYWGGIYDRTNGITRWLPYIGVDWTINAHWQLFAVAPWPSINYAPDPTTVFVLGISPNGSYLPLTRANEKPVFTDTYRKFGEFVRWDISLRAEKQLTDFIWVGASVGMGLLGEMNIQQIDGEKQTLDLKDSGFFMLSLSFRPQ